MAVNMDELLEAAAPLRVLPPGTDRLLVRLAADARRPARRRKWLSRFGIGAGVVLLLLGGGAAYAAFVEPIDFQPDNGQPWSSIRQWQASANGVTMACSLGFSADADALPPAERPSLSEARRFVSTLNLDTVAASASFQQRLTADEGTQHLDPRPSGITPGVWRDDQAETAAGDAMQSTVLALISSDLKAKHLPAVPDAANEELGGQCQPVSR
ncbi:hypothetical protein ACFOYW_14070 [Gryllotalpicola reticulitermitis]|uniref:Uncharacterized protein n=1 Tax=Gryllotalpicola reticulitermitis TaxID=1184153 RepID=A0ABV8QB10_9MICO